MYYDHHNKMSIFKKCEVQIILVHTGTYWYILVHTGTDIIHKHASFESCSIRFPSLTSLQCTLDASFIGIAEHSYDLFQLLCSPSQPVQVKCLSLCLDVQVWTCMYWWHSMYKYVLACTCMYLYVLMYTSIQHVLVQQEFRWSKCFLCAHVHLKSLQNFSMCHAAVLALLSAYSSL